MKARLLVTSIALPLTISSIAAPAKADDGCGNMNWFQCQASRLGYFVTHGGKTDPAPAKPAPVPKPAPIAVAPAPAPVISNDGGSVISHDGGTVVSQGGGNVVASGGGNVVASGGGNVVGPGGASVVASGGGNLIGSDGAGVVASGGGNIVASGGGNVVGPGGASVVASGGGNIVASGGGNIVASGGGNLASTNGGNLLSEHGAGLVLRGPSAYKDIGPTPEQLAAQKAMTDMQDASKTVLTASDQLKRDSLVLQNAQATNDVTVIKQYQAKVDADTAALKTAGIAMAAKATLVDAKDVPAAQALITNTVTTVQKDSDSVKAAAAAATPSGPSATQIATMNAAAGKAQEAAAAADKTNNAVQSLVAQLGSRPNDPADQIKVNQAMAQNAVAQANSNLEKDQAQLVKLSANKASSADIQAQKDLIAKDQKELSFQKGMVANDYAGKRVVADTAASDLTHAQAVVDGLTKAYGGTRPSDPQQLANMNAALMVMALAQDKADQTQADAQAARLIASGASKNDIQVQQDLSATKQKDIQNILKVNSTTMAAAGVAGATDPAVVSKALTNLVTDASKQTAADAQQKAAALQQANTALQQAKAAPSAPVANASAQVSETTASLVESLKKSGETMSAMSVKKEAAVSSAPPALPGSNTAAASTAVVNPTGSGAPTTSAKAPASAPAVDKTEITPAYAQQLLKVGPAVIQGLQDQQQAALAKGDKALADGLGKDIASLQAQIAVAKAMPAATSQPATASAPTAGGNASTAAGASSTSASGAAASTPAVAAAPSTATPQQPVVNKSELTPAVAQQLLTAGPTVVKGLQDQQQAALAKGDKVLADGLAKDIASLQAQIAVAKAMPAATSQPATASAPAAGANASTAAGASSTPARAPAAPVAEPPKAPSTQVTTLTQPQKVQPAVQAPPSQPKAAALPSTPPKTAVHPSTPPKMAAQPHTPLRAAPPAPPRTPAVAAAATTTSPARPPASPAPKAQTCTPNMVNGRMMGMNCH